jgi:hypothetical protein
VSNGWKVWFGFLGAAAVVGGLGLYSSASSNFDANNSLAGGAPQQSVVAVWHTNDLLTIVILELVIAVVAVVSVGYVLRESLGPRGPIDEVKPVIVKDEVVQQDRDHSAPA